MSLDKDRTVTAFFVARMPSLTVDVSVLDFGDLAVGQGAPAQTITVSNVGTWDLEMGQAELWGLHSSDFSVTQDQCSATSLPAGGDCTISVAFTPSKGNLRAADLSVNSNDFLKSPYDITLRDFGLADEETIAPVPNNEPPYLWITPAAVDFGQEDWWSHGSILEVAVYNIGGGQVEIVDAVIEGPDAEHFAFEDSSCAGAILGAGESCGANLFFLPKADGFRRASWVVKVSTEGVDDVRANMYGVAGDHAKPARTEVKALDGAGGGCSVGSASADGPGGLLALALLLAALFLLRTLRTLRTSLTALTLLLIAGTPAVLSTSSCDEISDPMGECGGEVALMGTGVFSQVNDTWRYMAMASNITGGCGETQFEVLEDVPSGGYINNEYFGISVYLQSPLFVGRQYKRGTKLRVQQRGQFNSDMVYIYDGFIEVVGVSVPPTPTACVSTATLRFAIDSVHFTHGGTVPFEALEASPGELTGTVKYSYGAYMDECNPAPIEHIGTDVKAGKTGQHIFPSGGPDPREVEIPVLYRGTEVNRVNIRDTVYSRRAEDGSKTLDSFHTVEVVPPPFNTGNYLCLCAHTNPGIYPVPRCPTGVFHNAPFALGAGAPKIPRGLSDRICDNFGIGLELGTWETGPAPPTIMSPADGEPWYRGDPLELLWIAPPEFRDKSVILRTFAGNLTGTQMDEVEPLFELEVADNGKVELAPAFLENLDGTVSFQVERTYYSESDFPWPTAPGSNIFIRSRGEVTLNFEEGHHRRVGGDVHLELQSAPPEFRPGRGVRQSPGLEFRPVDRQTRVPIQSRNRPTGPHPLRVQCLSHGRRPLSALCSLLPPGRLPPCSARAIRADEHLLRCLRRAQPGLLE